MPPSIVDRNTDPVNGAPRRFLFTSESVGDGHPDKICDQISDAILDTCLLVDPLSKVAVDTALTNGLVIVLGIITTSASLDVDDIVRKTLREIGYTQRDMGIEYKTCEVIDKLEVRRPRPENAPFSFVNMDRHVAGDQVRHR
jgi:S-adenosylmethionine synthetase